MGDHIRIKSDYSHLDRLLDKVGSAPTAKGVQALEAMNRLALTEMQLSTHVDTSSLRFSEKESSEEGRNSWTGTLTAGGSTLGPKADVDYAIYEKARGGEHDFTASQALLAPAWAAAVMKGWT